MRRSHRPLFCQSPPMRASISTSRPPVAHGGTARQPCGQPKKRSRRTHTLATRDGRPHLWGRMRISQPLVEPFLGRIGRSHVHASCKYSSLGVAPRVVGKVYPLCLKAILDGCGHLSSPRRVRVPSKHSGLHTILPPARGMTGYMRHV